MKTGWIFSLSLGVCFQAAASELQVELVPKLTVKGAGSRVFLERADRVGGPWTTWVNIPLNSDGTVMVDLEPRSTMRFYRVVADARPGGPPGFVWIPPGTFVMGEENPGPFNWDRKHTVTLTKGFWMCDHEVTQLEYASVMKESPSRFLDPQRFTNTPLDLPVEQVSWRNANEYCRIVTLQERRAGRITERQVYRLPTSAQWEYAARAGTQGLIIGDLNAMGWIRENRLGYTHPVKQKLPNAWGLYDMIGNVAEWCLDYWNPHPEGPVTDPVGQMRPAPNPATLVVRWMPGKDWGNRYNREDAKYDWVGFRVILIEID
jgi:formylglycine-generating enzyme required for sulfatase activity